MHGKPNGVPTSSSRLPRQNPHLRLKFRDPRLRIFCDRKVRMRQIGAAFMTRLLRCRRGGGGKWCGGWRVEECGCY